MEKILKKSLKKNDEIEVDIVRMGANGEGIATHDGMVIFVNGAIVGERVLVHIINDKNSFLIAKVVKILKKSSNRVEPKCPYFSKCGGCDLQHLSGSLQDELKTNIVSDTLKKYAKIDTKVNVIISGERVFRYRNKFAFPVREVAGEINIGMFKKNSHQVVDIDDCLLQSERVKTIISCVREFMQEEKISAYNEETNTGVVKHIVAREHGDEFVLTVVVGDPKFNNFEPLIKKLKTHFSSFGLYKNINLKPNNVIFGEKDEHIFGIEELEFNEFGIKYFVNNRSFLQVNDEIKNLIYKKIIELVGNQKTVIDAYSGAGLLSSIIAKNAAKVYGVEIVKESTQNAEKLKKINNLYNLTNKNGDCAVEIPRLANQLEGEFAVVVDPPRKGLDAKVIDAFLKSKPTRIVYLSCNPATLARDVALFKDEYDLTFVQPYNMFPQTSNIETLVCLDKKVQKTSKISEKMVKNKKNTKKLSEKSKYFDFYDDVKSSCHKIIDW